MYVGCVQSFSAFIQINDIQSCIAINDEVHMCCNVWGLCACITSVNPEQWHPPPHTMDNFAADLIAFEDETGPEMMTLSEGSQPTRLKKTKKLADLNHLSALDRRGRFDPTTMKKYRQARNTQLTMRPTTTQTNTNTMRRVSAHCHHNDNHRTPRLEAVGNALQAKHTQTTRKPTSAQNSTVRQMSGRRCGSSNHPDPMFKI